MSASFILTIDGPAGVGKSTLAKRAAQALGIAYLDTGAMFRTLALAVERTDPKLCGEELETFLRGFAFDLRGVGCSTSLLCNGGAVGDEIRSEEAGLAASRFAVKAEAREVLKELQRALGRTADLVAEGRDMGTVVFPDARCKIFLDARPDVRAMRRADQLRGMGQSVDVGELTEQIRLRDETDRNRPIAPLKPAADAITIDTSELDIDAVFARIMEAVRAAGANRPR